MTGHAHTPGEWNISAHAVPDYVYQVGIYADGSANGDDIATVKSCEADARLIVAAPALLAYGLEALRVLEEHGIGDTFEARGLRAAIYDATEGSS